MKNVNVNERNKENLYKELRKMFNYHCEFIDTTNACIEWWLIAFDDEAAGDLIFDLAEIIDDHSKVNVFDAANILVECELRSICNYARSIRNRMDAVELANYARDKFLNDLFDAVENEFGEI